MAYKSIEHAPSPREITGKLNPKVKADFVGIK
jgi:hypothetical protein